jgi:phosphate-selective porin
MLIAIAAGGTAVAQAPAEQQAAPAPQVEPVAPPPVAAPKAEKPPVTQSWGKGTIGLLLQGWFTASTDTRFSAALTSPKFAPSGENNAGTSTFRLRRAEMSYDGSVAKIVKYRAMIDPTIIQNGPITGAVSGDQGHETDTVTVKDILQDAWVGVMVPFHEVRLGQFKIPLTMEGFGSSGKLDFAERSLMGRTFGDQRDIGLMVLSDKVPYVEYELALVNGAGKNVYDNSPQKTGVFRRW